MNKVVPGVAEHLAAVVRRAVVSNVDKGVMNVSLKTLMTRIGAEFDRFVVTRTAVFGSFTRDTLLPAAIDPETDVDVLVVFRERGQKPAVYIEKLRQFAALHYPSSAIISGNGTLHLKLVHARVELVPALEGINGLQIPGKGPLPAWVATDPEAAARELREKNAAHQGLILPLVRLARYWNALNDYPFASFELEQRVVGHRFAFVAKNLKAYFFDFMRSLPAAVTAGSVKAERIRVMRRTLEEIDQLLLGGKPEAALAKMEALLPFPEKLLHHR